MRSVSSRIDAKLYPISESKVYAWYKDIDSPDYDRQMAEDALFHTIGPLTATPMWSKKWTSRSEPVPGFEPGKPAPRWSEDEVIYAYCGDPSLLFQRKDGNPKSPGYGRSPAPMLRSARAVANSYNVKNIDTIIELYNIGMGKLVSLMQPGHDKSMSAFISWVYPTIKGAMLTGYGATEETQSAAGFKNEDGSVGFKGLLSKDITGNNPEEIRRIAGQIRGKYRETSSHDKHPDNPLGKYSPAFYQLANALADAFESRNVDRIESVKNQIQQKIEEIEDANVPVRGMTTGVSKAITDKSRKEVVKVVSGDAPSGRPSGEEGGTILGALAGKSEDEPIADPETVNMMLELALTYDVQEVIAKVPSLVQELDLKGQLGEIRGPLTANEFRCIIRSLGPICRNYPGRSKKGKPNYRRDLSIPRGAPGWWNVGSDPEVEPFRHRKNGTIVEATWTSTWVRGDNKKGIKPFEAMNQVQIMSEFTKEAEEFSILKIPTKYKIKEDPKVLMLSREYQRLLDARDPREIAAIGREVNSRVSKDDGGHEYLRKALEYAKAIAEDDLEDIRKCRKWIENKMEVLKASSKGVLSKVSLSKFMTSATTKLKLIAFLERESLGVAQVRKRGGAGNILDIDESVIRQVPLLEEISRTSRIDRELIAEACDWACARLEAVLYEKAPPGWSKTVEHMKKKGMSAKEAFSRAWATYNKGGSKPDARKKNKYYSESFMKPVDAISDDIYEIE